MNIDNNICKDCGKSFKNWQAKANHVRWNHQKLKFSSKGLSNVKSSNDKTYGKLLKFKVVCYNPRCKKEFFIKEREKSFPKKEKYFCCRSCANSNRPKSPKRITKEYKVNLSNKIKEAWKRGCFNDLSKTNKYFSSKGEREIRKYFKEMFPDDDWTSGGGIIFKNTTISRDLYSNKLKVCVEYDGIWHFFDIKGQLSQKQYKDHLLEEWCRLHNYRLIRISENLYNDDKEYWLHKLTHAIYVEKLPIIKFYEKIEQ